MANDVPVDRPARPARRPRDLVISLVVLLVPVLVLIGGYQLLTGRTQPVAVDPAATVSMARQAGVAAVTPEGLPQGWVPIGTDFRAASPPESGGTLRIGYVTPAGGSVQIVQSTLPAEELLRAELPGAAPAGAVALTGRDWQEYQLDGGERALVWLTPEQTVLIRGAADQQELHDLGDALR